MGHVASGGWGEPQGCLCGQKRTAGPPALKGSPAPQVHGHHSPGRGQAGEPLGGGGSSGLILGVRLYERALPSSLFTAPNPLPQRFGQELPTAVLEFHQPLPSLAAAWQPRRPFFLQETPVEGVPDAGSQPHRAVSCGLWRVRRDGPRSSRATGNGQPAPGHCVVSSCPSAGSTGLARFPSTENLLPQTL